MWMKLLKAVLLVASPVIIDFVLNYAVQKAEEKFKEAKSGKDKKAYVINFVTDFISKSGLKVDLSKAKLESLIESKVQNLINTI